MLLYYLCIITIVKHAEHFFITLQNSKLLAERMHELQPNYLGTVRKPAYTLNLNNTNCTDGRIRSSDQPRSEVLEIDTHSALFLYF